MKNRLNKKRGFTLVETLVSVLILAVSITALIVITAQGVFNLQTVRTRIMAHYLAQEGIELIRNQRDTFILNGTSFQDVVSINFSGCDVEFNQFGCIVAFDPTNGSTTLDTCGNDFECPPLRNDDLGYYHYGIDALDDSIFTRSILMEKTSGQDEVLIRSVVEWDIGGGPKSLENTLYLSNWVNSQS